MRIYNEKIVYDEWLDLMTVEMWEKGEPKMIPDWGEGYWAKGGMMSRDDVFETDKEDATHVVWFNK